MVYFEHPEYLFLLIGVPVLITLFLLLLRWKRRTARAIGDPSIVAQLTSNYSPKKFSLKFILVLIGFTTLVVCVASLVTPKPGTGTKRTGMDVMIALDVSNSMLATDIKPTRLERAKQLVAKIIDKLPENKIGIVIFAGKAYLQMPLTIDHSAAKMYLASATPDDVPTQGTVIADALKMCYSAFNIKEKRYRAVILLTDGEDHDEDAISVTKELAKEGITLNTVGIGSPQGSLIVNANGEVKKDEQGNNVVTRLNEDELKQIAQAGNGQYQLLTSVDQVAGTLQQQLSSVQQTSTPDPSTIAYQYYYWIFALLALIALVVELFITDAKKAVRLTACLLFVMASGGALQAQSSKELIAAGNEAYKKKDYKKAGESYASASKADPKNAIATYNLGNVLYRSNNPAEAEKAYQAAIDNAPLKTDKQRAFYNKGVALQKQNKLPECIDAYKNALRIDPADEDARQNLERALKQQKDKQDKSDKNKDNSDNNKNKQDKQNQDNPKPQPSKISKQDADEKLKSLAEHEKSLQDKLKKGRAASPVKPEKDW